MADEIKSVAAFLDTLDKECPDAQMYRGQGEDWPLVPPIGRYPNYVKSYENWQVFHEDLIEQFLRLGNPFFSSKPTDECESWVVAQHHGVPTRLIDTTTNPLKALFFAVGNPVHDSNDGAIWVFSFSGWREDLDNKYRDYWDGKLIPFFPAQIHERLTAQEGTFLCYPLPESVDPLVPIDAMTHPEFGWRKYIVPASSKTLIRHEISILGAKQHLLFPDLDGVAASIRNRVLESDRKAAEEEL